MVHSVTAHSVLARWMLWLKHWSVDSVSKQGLFIFWGGNSLERLGDAIWWVSEGGKNKKSGLLSQELTHCFPADRPMINSYVPGTEYSCSWHASHISAGEQPSARPATHLKLQKKKKIWRFVRQEVAGESKTTLVWQDQAGNILDSWVLVIFNSKVLQKVPVPPEKQSSLQLYITEIL